MNMSKINPFSIVMSLFHILKKAFLLLLRIVKKISLCLGFIVLILIIFGVVAKYKSDKSMSFSQNAVVSVDLKDVSAESRSDELLLNLAGVSSVSFFDFLNGLNNLSMIPEVKVVVIYTDDLQLGLSQVQDLRGAIKDLNAKGKKTVAFSSGFGSFGGGILQYYLATACDEIWLQPGSEIGITGISIEVPYFKNSLDKIGVQAEFYSRYEYKTAMSSFTDDEMSDYQKLEFAKLGLNLLGTIIDDISLDRNIGSEALSSYIDNAPLFEGDDGFSVLVDRVGYRSDLHREFLLQYNAELVNFDDYLSSLTDDFEYFEKEIALLVLDGVIESGDDSSNPWKEGVIGSLSVIEQLEEIQAEDKVSALVIRVNSPGGSYTASNEIWNAILTFKKTKNIPVIISMGDYAASGGYFISLAGDEVFAQPSTITGSIGVLGGKFVFGELWNKLGINWQQINFGENAGLLSPNRKFTEKELMLFNKSLDYVYKDFTAKVSSSRNISLDDLDNLARGRVWTGSQAKEHSLVDAIGGLDSAIYRAAELGGLLDNDKISITYYPKEKTVAEKLSEIVGKGRKSVDTNKILNHIGMKDLILLKQLEHDAIMMPVQFNM